MTTVWTDAAAGASSEAVVQQSYTFTGDGTTTSFALTGAPKAIPPAAVIVAIDGVTQTPSVAYSIGAGPSLVFTEAPPAGAAISAVALPNKVLYLTLKDADASSLNVTAPGATTPRTLAQRAGDVVNVRDFGAKGDGIADDAARIQAAIDAVAAAGGGTLYAGPGVYAVGSAVSLKDNVIIVGCGDTGATIKALGDFPALQMVGTSSDPINNAGVHELCIRGGGKANANAHGVKTQWTNRCSLRGVRFFSCRNAVDAANSWQFEWSNLSADGEGAEQNYNGFYLREGDAADVNNAVIAHNCIAQSVQKYGFRIEGGNGSKFTSCEAGACEVGWYIGDAPSGKIPMWMHIANCLADSTSSHGWVLSKGTASDAQLMELSNCWAGNALGSGFYLQDIQDTVLTGILSVSTVNAIRLIRCARVTVAGSAVEDYDRANQSEHGIRVSDSTDCVLTATTATSAPAGGGSVSYYEEGASARNKLIGASLQHGYQVTSTCVVRGCTNNAGPLDDRNLAVAGNFKVTPSGDGGSTFTGIDLPLAGLVRLQTAGAYLRLAAVGNGGIDVTLGGARKMNVESSQVYFDVPPACAGLIDATDDAAAAAAGVPVGRFYRTGSTIKVRIA